MEVAAETAAPARRRGTSRVPVPLGALLVVVAILGVTWALLVPAWQAPDEPQHFAYAQSLAERLALPGNAHRAPFSTSQAYADSVVGASREAFYPGAVPPDWSAQDYARYGAALAASAPSNSNGGGPNTAASNPPLYYLYAGLAYWVSGSGANAFAQLYAMRLWTVALLLVSTVGGWLLAGEVLGRRRLAQLACAAVTALVPAQTFISASVNPDSLMVALWSLALWLGARVIVRAGARRDSFALGLVTAGAVLTKATSYALVPAVLLALVIGWRRQPTDERRGPVAALGPPLAALALPILAWLALASALGRSAVNTVKPGPGAHAFNVRQFLSYLWQFYLPRLSFMTRFRETPGLPVYALWIREGWGVFGWRNVSMGDAVYRALGVISGLVAIASAAILVRFRDGRRLSLLAFFALALLALLAGLHVTDYRAIIAAQPAVIQGRYLLPVLPLFGLAVGLLITRAPIRWRGPACGATVAGLLLLQLLALATIAGGYYT